MKTFKTCCAQGDVLIRRIAKLPNEAVPVKTKGKHVTVAHSETGHDHIMDAENVTMYQLPDSILDCLLVVNRPTVLEHLREFDRHEPILFEKGVYHVRRQREYTPEGFRRVED